MDGKYVVVNNVYKIESWRSARINHYNSKFII